MFDMILPLLQEFLPTLLAGPILAVLFQVLKAVTPVLDGLSKPFKELALGALATLLGFGATFVPALCPDAGGCSLATVDVNAVGATLSAIISHGLFKRFFPAK